MFTGNIVRFINCTPPFMTTTPLLNASEDQPMSKLVIYACSCFWLLLFSGGEEGCIAEEIESLGVVTRRKKERDKMIFLAYVP